MLRNIFASVLLVSGFVQADENNFVIELKNNTFIPAVLHIPARKKVKIKIINLDNEPEEFDSFDLNREKVLFPQKPATIYIGPLAPGEYYYFGEFHPNVAKGKIVADHAGVKQVNNQKGEQ